MSYHAQLKSLYLDASSACSKSRYSRVTLWCDLGGWRGVGLFFVFCFFFFGFFWFFFFWFFETGFLCVSLAVLELFL